MMAKPDLKKPTLKDVALDAGISLATLDRVLNNRPGVRASTVARAKEAMARLGYTPNFAAASLAKGKPLVVRLLIDKGADMTRRYIASNVEGVTNYQMVAPITFEIQEVDHPSEIIEAPGADQTISFVRKSQGPTDKSDVLHLAQRETAIPIHDQSLTKRFWYAMGKCAAIPVQPLQRQFCLSVGVLTSKARPLVEREILRGLMETMGARLSVVKSASDPEALSDCGILILARDPASEELATLRKSHPTRLVLAAQPTERVFDALYGEQIDGAVTFDLISAVALTLQKTFFDPTNGAFPKTGIDRCMRLTWASS